MERHIQKCHVVGAGPSYGYYPTLQEGDLLIAADGGWEKLQAIGLVPHLIIGDFDSASQVPNHPETITLPTNKDNTDMQAALELGIERGYTQLHLYCGTGGRGDHTMANLQLLAWLNTKGCRGYLYGEGWVATAITNDTLGFDSTQKGYVSVFAMGAVAKGVTLHGLKYTLNGAELRGDTPLGVSNEFLGVDSSITVEEGTLLIYWYP